MHDIPLGHVSGFGDPMEESIHPNSHTRRNDVGPTGKTRATGEIEPSIGEGDITDANANNVGEEVRKDESYLNLK